MIRFLVGAFVGAVVAHSFPALRAPSIPDLPSLPRMGSPGSAGLPSSVSHVNSAWCFVPDGASCQALLIEHITGARKQILVQAYEFTNAPIAKALVEAHRRGVDVRVIVDKSQVSGKYSSATFLRNEGIPLVVDTQPAIAHNKVMIFDGAAVFTGSYNFTKAAETRNAENGIVLSGNNELVAAYIDNWNKRLAVSTRITNAP